MTNDCLEDTSYLEIREVWVELKNIFQESDLVSESCKTNPTP